MIDKKEQIIDYFKSGIKESKKFKIGIEHEKFLFDLNSNKRIDYAKVKEMFSALAEFGWKPILEKNNIIGLNKDGKNITLEPGNQIELSGDQLNNIHEACAESQDYLFELRQVTKKLNIKIVSAGFDPMWVMVFWYYIAIHGYPTHRKSVQHQDRDVAARSRSVRTH